ncbi:HEAT repeat domain-containing protein [Myxococcus sp. K15C18031901]|uniref:HEAT repeat domain-containing protein n=1 Tax=Myxococcus dinghuensis TaxID=2906761 RepID=UPI0020A7028C|nr:HEAT repeat domain-containing protein [Myxococcus dinghuensis]MCP3101228.1 HEAT repeat domain-containing protein [Myxococcus dinghuensis]
MTTPTFPTLPGSAASPPRAKRGRWWTVALGLGLAVGPAGVSAAAYRQTMVDPSAGSSAQSAPSGDLQARVLALLDAPGAPEEESWRRLGPQAIPVLSALVVDGSAPASRRTRAVAPLALLDPSLGANPLQEVLADVHAPAEVRVSAAQSLGRCLGIGAIPVLTPRLMDQEDQVREAVAVALGRLGGQQARLALEERLPVEERPLVREALQRGLSLAEP